MLRFNIPELLAAALIFPIISCSPALPAIQHLSARDPYQGGWPLALTGTNSNTCPTDASVKCSSTNVNPECCPSGQTCFWGAVQFTNYCCPTNVDCATAVLNFPRCANTTWNMFLNSPTGYFCCEPGTLGVVPSVGKDGGICEPSDQVIPTSLLATLVAQVGVATPTPTASITASNATTTGSGPAETNPSSAPTSTSACSDANSGSQTSCSSDSISNWSKPAKIGAGAAIGAAFVAFLVVGALCNRRRRRNALAYGYVGNTAEFDEYGNRVPGYTPGYESFRRAHRPTENNVTVNVVQGDMQHS